MLPSLPLRCHAGPILCRPQHDWLPELRRRGSDGPGSASWRPPNAVEDRLHGLPLPFAGDFVRLELGPEEVVRTSLRDGKDHYYILRQDDARIPWQAFGQEVDNDWFPDEPAVRDGGP